MPTSRLERHDSADSVHWELRRPGEKHTSLPVVAEEAWQTSAPGAEPPRGRPCPPPPRGATPRPRRPAPPPPGCSPPRRREQAPAATAIDVVAAMRDLAVHAPGSSRRTAGLRLPALGQERGLLVAIDNVLMPAARGVATVPEERTAVDHLLNYRDLVTEFFQRRDYAGVAALLARIDDAALTPALAAIIRALRLETLLYVRRRRAQEAAAGAAASRAASALGPLHDLEHRLVAGLVGGT